ncbi:MAG: glycosyltransferase family 2 protein [Actinobacteria bacterium]|nr:glycosyltransferase family 2 protein [Actinomycetota bacterium]
MKISSVVLTKNEEKNIENCLKSVEWCNEIIVLDDESSDKTPQKAEKFGAKILNHKLVDFASQRNYGLTQAKNNWVLFIDADEVISGELKKEIEIEINNNDFDGFYINRKDYVLSKNLKWGDLNNVYLLRIAKKDNGRWIGKVHEKWIINGKTKKLKNTILHYPHSTLDNFLSEINFYSGLRANELLKSGKKVNFFTIITYPLVKFIYNYFFRLGFLDGTEGFIFNGIMSFYSFLVRAKIWKTKNER